jgi:hypothetical protein
VTAIPCGCEICWNFVRETATRTTGFFNEVTVRRNRPTERKIEPPRFGFEVPSGGSQSQALFRHFAVFRRQF